MTLVYTYNYRKITAAKPSANILSDDDPGVRHSFGAETSSPLKQSAAALSDL